MNFWAQVDAFVAKHQARLAELRRLAGEGGRYLTPRFRAPCVWTLRTNSRVPESKTLVFTDFDSAKAELEVHAQRMREVRAEREAEKQRRRDELHNRKKKGGVNAHESHVPHRGAPGAQADRCSVRYLEVEFEAGAGKPRRRADVRTPRARRRGARRAA